MEAPRTFGIYLARGSSGEILLLHPFRPGSIVLREPETIVLEGRYASEPGPGEGDFIRKTLHGELERGLRRDALDRGFYPRLLVSAAVFLVLYLFLSIVVRDPVPLVDELLAGGLGAAAAWFALERRSLSSDAFARRSATLRRTLDTALFRPSRAAAYLEEVLQEAESLDLERLAEYPASAGGGGFPEEDIRELEELADALEARLPPSVAEAAKESLSGRGDLFRLLRKKAAGRAPYLPMLLTYVRIKTLCGAGA